MYLIYRYDEDEEDGYGDDEKWNAHRPVSGHDSDSDGEDEDDVLEMCTPSSLKLKFRSKSKASSSSSSSASPSEPRRRPSVRRTHSSDREHVTIAPIAPTTLKTTGAGERTVWGDSFGDDYNYSDDNDTRWYPGERQHTSSSEHTPVELVYVPPLGSSYHLHAEPEGIYSLNGRHYDEDADDTLVLPPSAAAAASRAHAYARPAVQTGDREEFESAYDYFGGPDFGDEFSRTRTASTREREEVARRGRSEGSASVSDNMAEGEGGREMLRFAHGGAASVTGGRSPAELPEVVLNGRSGVVADSSSPLDTQARMRILSRLGSGRRTRTPSPIEFSSPSDPTPARVAGIGRADPHPTDEGLSLAVPVSPGHGNRPVLHPRSASYSPPPALLPAPTRGRSGLPKSASALALGADAVQERGRGRGRSSTRSSPSVSDRERDRYGGSPMGSLSPEGLGGLGGARGYAYAGGRDMEREKEKERDRERTGGRGRERTSRRVGANPSPEDASMNSRSRDSSASPAVSAANGNARPVCLDLAKDRVNGVALNAATATFQREAEVHRSWNPTPVNSPITDTFGKSPFSATSPPVSPTTRMITTAIVSTPLAATSPSSKMYSPNGVLRGTGRQANNAELHLENGTLVSRAVGIVSSAGAYLGLWHNNLS